MTWENDYVVNIDVPCKREETWLYIWHMLKTRTHTMLLLLAISANGMILARRRNLENQTDFGIFSLADARNLILLDQIFNFCHNDVIF